MTILHAIVLGIIQGLTEFLPVSSSGHLVFVPAFLGWSDQGLSFDVVVHLGSLLAVLIYFREKIWGIISSLWKRNAEAKLNRILGFLLLLSIFPAGLVGLFAEEWIETIFRSTTVVAITLIGWGLVLYLADKYNQRLQKRRIHLADVHEMSWRQVAIISCAQALALIPGTSRSGITMTAGLFGKLSKTGAAEFSFLMSVPVILIAGAVKVLDLVQQGFGDISVSILSAGFIASAVSGFLAIWGLMKIIQKWSFAPFAVYRVVVGIAILIFLV